MQGEGRAKKKKIKGNVHCHYYLGHHVYSAYRWLLHATRAGTEPLHHCVLKLAGFKTAVIFIMTRSH